MTMSSHPLLIASGSMDLIVELELKNKDHASTIVTASTQMRDAPLRVIVKWTKASMRIIIARMILATRMLPQIAAK